MHFKHCWFGPIFIFIFTNNGIRCLARLHCTLKAWEWNITARMFLFCLLSSSHYWEQINCKFKLFIIKITVRVLLLVQKCHWLPKGKHWSKSSPTQGATLVSAVRIFLLNRHDFTIQANLHWLGNVLEGSNKSSACDQQKTFHDYRNLWLHSDKQ